jgi:hypothetical protein
MFKDSRYRGESVFPHRFRDAVRVALTFREIPRDPPEGSVLHTLKAGDTLDLLAHVHLGSGEFWWVIADVNPHIEPMDLRNYIGEEIIIPPKSAVTSRLSIATLTRVVVDETTPSAYVYENT